MHGNGSSNAPERGEWECDECGYVISSSSDKPPQGRCPDCGESAEESFTFFSSDDDFDDYDDDDESDDF